MEDGFAGLQSFERATSQACHVVESARKIYGITGTRYEGGLAASLGAITAQQSLLNSQHAAVQIPDQQMTTSVFPVKVVDGDRNHAIATPIPTAQR